MANQKTSIDIVVPIYNEEVELEKNIRRLHAFLQTDLADYAWSVIIADNASTDASGKISQKLLAHLSGLDYLHISEKGRGRAVKKAWNRSRADIVAYMDLDLSTNLRHFPSLIRAVERGYDLAVGSRLLSESRVENRPAHREILSRGYNLLIKVMFGTKFSDAQCGFKAMSKPAVTNLLPFVYDDEWFFDSELLILAEKSGYKIYDQPVLWIDNPGSTVRVLKTFTGDFKGLWRMWLTKPWQQLKKVGSHEKK